MKKIVIYGASGHAKEMALLIEEINEKNKEWEIIGFIDDFKTDKDVKINGYPLVKLDNILDKYESIAVVIGVGYPNDKITIYEKLKKNEKIFFPNLVHPNCKISKFINMGVGNIISNGAILTTSIKIHNFVTIGINCTISHDSEIMSFTSIFPNASISGNVNVGEAVTIGTNSTIIEKIEIASNSIIGAGSTVIRNIETVMTVAGNPAVSIKRNLS